MPRTAAPAPLVATLLRATVLAGATLLPLRGTGAQDVAYARAAAATTGRCLADVRGEHARHVLVQLVPGDAGAPFAEVPRAAWESVVLASEAIGWNARALLGAPEGDLPQPDTLLSWRNAHSHLHIVARRDGTMRWSLPWETLGHSSQPVPIVEPALRLLGAAVDRALERGERFSWPDDLAGDSLFFELRLAYPVPLSVGVTPLRARHSVPLVAVRAPVYTPVVALEPLRIRHPRALSRGVKGSITVEFTVDTAGRVPPGSIRDRRDRDEPAPSGELARYYRSYLREMKRTIERTRWGPARIGGCLVEQRVVQEFNFIER